MTGTMTCYDIFCINTCVNFMTGEVQVHALFLTFIHLYEDQVHALFLTFIHLYEDQVRALFLTFIQLYEDRFDPPKLSCNKKLYTFSCNKTNGFTFEFSEGFG
jgi:hypothetical protein